MTPKKMLSRQKIKRFMLSMNMAKAINKDLSGLTDAEAQPTQTELEAVIAHIEEITERLNITEVKRPWLPPLPENVYQDELMTTDFKALWNDQPGDVELTLGLKDVPEEQPRAINPKIKSIRTYCLNRKSRIRPHDILTQHYFRYCTSF